MTDKRLNESAIGLAGRLSHIPYGTDKAEHCGWQYTRKFTRNGKYNSKTYPEVFQVSVNILRSSGFQTSRPLQDMDPS